MSNWNDYDYCMAAVKQSGWALEFVKKQTPELCMAAVTKNGRALEYVSKDILNLVN